MGDETCPGPPLAPSAHVKITLLSEDSIRIEPTSGLLTIESPTAELSYSPFHMMGSGLGLCTFALLDSWGSNVGLSVDDLVIDVAWEFADHPHRVGSIALTFSWPSLPRERLETARRATALCPLHATFEHPPTITIGERE